MHNSCDAMIKKAIIYPIANGNYNDSSHELIFSLRSVAEHFQKNPLEEIPVFVISEECPPYLSDCINYVKCSGYLDALVKACQIAEEFVWMNDDIFFLTDHSWEDMREWDRRENEVSEGGIEEMVNGTGWSRRKGEVLSQLKKEGYTTYDYSSHTPYLYESEKLLPVIEKYEFGYKTPVETAYGNVYGLERSKTRKKLSRFHGKALPLDVSSYTILNYSDRADLAHLRGFLLGRFPKPCQYESYGNLVLSKHTLCKIK